MSDIKIHVFHTGEVCVAPDLPFGGDHCNAIKASDVFGKKEDRLWLLVSAYLIEHPKGKFLVAADEVKFAGKLTNKVRYYKGWWDDINLTEFEWNDNEGPFNKSYDLLNDGSIELINIPGHADGLFAVKVKNEEGKFVLLFSDGGYAKKSWEEMITSGIAADKEKQK